MRISFINWRPQKKTQPVIDRANEIIEEYLPAGLRLTLRQLYYQFVSRAWLENNQQNYNRLGEIVRKARCAGLIDWDSIEDRTRSLRKNSHWYDPAEAMEAVADQFKIDKWADQPIRPEVWIEKDALIGVIEKVCRVNDVSYFSCRGYVSASEVFDAGYRRFRARLENEQTPIILHLGDHDPSGIDMTRDIRERLELFAGKPIEVRRLALNADQVEQYNPPPNYAKQTDTRFEEYAALHGDESWELDALEPRVIVQLVQNAILSVRDDGVWARAVDAEHEARRQLTRVSEQWSEVVDFTGGGTA